ncbi:protein-methionine sulfoxide oxidase mical3b-like [Coregonus clupeaformis]|uniref:protein-methionine sulfoxide oxidase mical3b-like n=1 Tax=Coregonus clupeaformis TaxID=59861 RepID=UPI001E1C7605|nr:protein-methionine sulfoxide oxidase mical3b-like [Coregonus clupeaformis]
MEFSGCPAAAGVAVGDEAQEAEKEGHAHVLFDEFVQASTCRATLRAFNLLCEHLQLTHTHTQPQTYSTTQPQRPFYHTLKERLSYWKANALWAKLDKRAAHHEYGKGRVCANTTCVIIGAGPCGLRTAVELGFLGARVVLLEKRDAFSRNNVLHLWPFTIHDLRGLGAKKFYGKFCAGAIDHISIRQLQLVLLKVALLLGVEVHVNVEFKGLVEPPADQEQQKVGWRVEVKPKSHPINQLQCDVVIGADGRRNTLPGFRRKEFRGKLAIAITANFMNRNTTAEAKVEEISGVAFIFNQRFFQELRDATGVDLENIVYYKDDTHYFVMTAKKQSLLEKGVILRDYVDTETLLSRGNVDQNALLAYAREAADFSTNHQLPSLDFAMNHYGQPDVALFDFTCMYASENAALVRQRHGHHLLVTLVGDSLLEPFWPMGTGIARGFLAALDSAWMVRSWAQGLAPLDLLAERESLYRLLPQTTPEKANKNFGQYTVDPATRYPNINPQLITPAQVGHLIYTGASGGLDADQEPRPRSPLPKLLRQESFSRSSKLLPWCQQQTQGYRGAAVSDLTTSWKSGLSLCALIHHYRPDLIDFDSLEEDEGEDNMRLGLEVAEKEFGISPLMTVEEMSSVSETDTLCMVMYLSQFHQLFKDALPPSESQTESLDGRAAMISPASLLSRLGHSPSRKRNPKEQKEKDAVGKRRKTSRPCLEDVRQNLRLVDSYEEEAALCSVGGASQSRVRSMANQLLAKFEENALCPSSTPAAALRRQKYVQMYTGGVSSLAEQISNQVQSQEAPSPQHTPNRKESAGVRSVLAGAGPGPGGASDVCFFCSKRVYVMERLSAEGLFFHRSCFQCDHCSSTLRLASYAYDRPNGKFYCKPHYDLRLVGPVQRKRPAPPTADQPPTPYGRTPSQRTLLQESPAALSTNPRSSVAVVTADRRSSVASLIERECGLAKRVRGTPERIELENYRVSLETEQLTDEPEEVPEEMLANYNLSLLVTEEKKANYKRSPLQDKRNEGSSSESEMEEEGERQRTLTNDLARDSWRKAMELHARLRGERGEEEEETEEGEEEGEVDEDDDEEEELSSDEERSSLDEWQQSTHSPDTHSPDTHSPGTHSPDTHSPGTHSPDTHSPDTHSPDTHSPDTHSPDTHSPDTLMPDIHTPDIQLPDSTTPDTNGPQSPTSLRACWDSLPCPSVEAESLQSPAPRPAPRFAPAPIMASAVVRGVGGKKLKPWDVGGGRRSIAGGSVGGGSVGAGSLGEQLCKGEGIDPLEDISPPLSPLKPLKAVPRDEREMERRREIERAAMGVGWEDTKIPLGREPLPGKSRDGLDPRRLTESLPPLLLTQLQGGSLFPPHKSRRDNQPPSQSVPEAGIGEGGPLGLWRAVISGYKRDRKKKGRTSLPNTTTAPAPKEHGRRKTSAERRGVKFRERQSWSEPEESDITCSVVMERCSMNPKANRHVGKEKERDSSRHMDTQRKPSCPTEVVGVLVHMKDLKDPSSLDVSEAMFHRDRDPEEEQLDARLTRRVQRAARKQAKQEQLKRLHRAQMIQRQLEQVEEKQRQLEERGVAVEKALRGEADYWGESNDSEEMDLHLGVMGRQDDPALMQQWFKLVQQKNCLMRYESELMIFARELELEDRQSRLQQELRERMAVDDHLKGEAELAEEKLILGEMLEVVEQRDALVSLLEEQRLQESQEDRDLEAIMLSRGLGLHNWA